jgi:hypothetical protein
MNPLSMASWVIILSLIAYSPVSANEGSESQYPLERFSLRLGGMFSIQDSSFTFDQNVIGTTIDGEDQLGLDEDTIIFRGESFYRFGKRHKIHLGFFDLSRDSNEILEKQLIIDDEVFPINDVVDTEFDLRFYKVGYSYAFYQSNRLEIAGLIGFHVTDFDLEIRSETFGTFVGEDYTIPLPLLGLGGGFAITPKLFFISSVQGLYIDAGDWSGNIVDLNVALEYNLFENFGIGIGYNFLFLNVDSEDDDSLLGFEGEIDYDLDGFILYGKLFF